MTTERIALPDTSILTNITQEHKADVQRALANYSDRIQIVYHKDCLDGTIAGYAAWQLLNGRSPLLVSVTYQDSLPGEFFSRRVKLTIVFVGFCASPDILEAIVAHGHTVIVIDHHKSAIDKIMDYRKELTNFWYFVSSERLAVSDDQLHSGSSLTPAFFNYIETRPLDEFRDENLQHLVALSREHDLWLHNGDPQTDAMALAYWHKNKQVDDLIRMWMSGRLTSDGISEMIAEGRERLDKAVSEIEQLTRCGCIVEIGGKSAWLFYCERAYTSLAGSVVNKVHDIAISFYREEDKFKVSIRTAYGSGIDASELAGRFGGGGHKYAAGFYTDVYPAVLLTRKKPAAVSYHHSNVVINPRGC